MKIKVEYIILILIITALSAFLLLKNNNRTNYNLPQLPRIEEKDISKIILHKADEEILLAKENDEWLINKDKFSADKEKMNAIIKEIAGLNLSALVSESKNYAIYDLDKDKKIGLEVLSGDKTLLKMDIGKTASSYRHTFVKPDNDYKVYQANGNLRSAFDKKVSDLRDKSIMRFDEDIAEVILNDGRREMKITKKITLADSGAAEWTADKNEKIKGNEIEQIINNLRNMNCDDFAEGKTKDDFDKFIYKIELKGNKTYSISFIEKKDDKYIAISSKNAYPFFIHEGRAKNLMKELDSLIDKEKK
ncbi:MAG TPA: hypothetical protein DCQ99_01890 [Nitrospinae bacterium]|nr:hypothetical protein [Nitrospinota bacterium]HBA27166.1 hypothetical protein [Nitrospinota bacterium]